VNDSMCSKPCFKSASGSRAHNISMTACQVRGPSRVLPASGNTSLPCAPFGRTLELRSSTLETGYSVRRFNNAGCEKSCWPATDSAEMTWFTVVSSLFPSPSRLNTRLSSFIRYIDTRIHSFENVDHRPTIVSCTVTSKTQCSTLSAPPVLQVPSTTSLD